MGLWGWDFGVDAGEMGTYFKLEGAGGNFLFLLSESARPLVGEEPKVNLREVKEGIISSALSFTYLTSNLRTSLLLST